MVKQKNKQLDNLLTLGQQQASLHGSRSNAAFNTYKEGLDLEVLRRYCMEHGEVRTFLRGETLEEGGAARLTSVSGRVPG